MAAIPWKIFRKLHWQAVVELSVLGIVIKKLLSGELNKTVLVLEVRYFLGQIQDLDVFAMYYATAYDTSNDLD